MRREREKWERWKKEKERDIVDLYFRAYSDPTFSVPTVATLIRNLGDVVSYFEIVRSHRPDRKEILSDLGYFYEKGLGVTQDHRVAIQMYLASYSSALKDMEREEKGGEREKGEREGERDKRKRESVWGGAGVGRRDWIAQVTSLILESKFFRNVGVTALDLRNIPNYQEFHSPPANVPANWAFANQDFTSLEISLLSTFLEISPRSWDQVTSIDLRGYPISFAVESDGKITRRRLLPPSRSQSGSSSKEMTVDPIPILKKCSVAIEKFLVSDFTNSGKDFLNLAIWSRVLNGKGVVNLNGLDVSQEDLEILDVDALPWYDVTRVNLNRNPKLTSFPRFLQRCDPTKIQEILIQVVTPLTPDLIKIARLPPYKVIRLLRALECDTILDLSGLDLPDEIANLLHRVKDRHSYWSHIVSVDLRGNPNMRTLPIFLHLLSVDTLQTLYLGDAGQSARDRSASTNIIKMMKRLVEPPDPTKLDLSQLGRFTQPQSKRYPQRYSHFMHTRAFAHNIFIFSDFFFHSLSSHVTIVESLTLFPIRSHG